MNSPFKFLDSYTSEDSALFFGRDAEINEIYQKAMHGKILLVYGVSSAGKSSLVHCGLAGKFGESAWNPLTIRRGNSYPESVATALQGRVMKPEPIGEVTAVYLRELINQLVQTDNRPVYFILDQFEEIFIFGDKAEQQHLAELIRDLCAEPEVCRFILVIREEYLAETSEFEKVIPDFFTNRMRVERMSLMNAQKAVEGSCRATAIRCEEGFSAALLERLSPERMDVELTYLQVALEKVFHLTVEKESEVDSGITPLAFTQDILDDLGNTSDLLGSYLDEQVSAMPDPETALAVLKAFVSVKGTRRQRTIEEIREFTRALGKPVDEDQIRDLVQSFIIRRLLHFRDSYGRYELRHDVLAAKIFEQITLVEKELLDIRQFLENAYENWQKRGVLLSKEDLDYIAPYESRLFLPKAFEAFIERSRDELVRRKRRFKRIAIWTSFVLFCALGSLAGWALVEKQKSDKNSREVQARNYSLLAKQMEETDPTQAFRLAEHSLELDNNKQFRQIMQRIYMNNIFYNVLYKDLDDNDIYISPDWKKVLTCSGDGTLRLYDSTGIVSKIRGHLDQVTTAEFSPDGNRIITGSWDKTARLWDLSGKLLKIFSGHESVLTSIIFSTDGRKFLTGSWDGTVRLWSIDGGMLKIFRKKNESLSGGIFSPDGKSIFTGAWSGMVFQWDTTGRLLREFKGHSKLIRAIALAPNGRAIITGSDDRTARLWDLSGKVIQEFKGHKNSVTAVTFSTDGNTVITGSVDNEIRLWDLSGNLLQVLRGHTGEIISFAISSDGNNLLSKSWDRTVRVWDLSGSMSQKIMSYFTVTAQGYSADGKRILLGTNDGQLSMCDLSGNLIFAIKGHTRDIWSVNFSPDGKSILTASWDNSAHLYDLSGKLLQEFKGHKGELWSAVFSADGRYILTGSWDRTARLWDLSGKVLTEFIGHSDKVLAVAFFPDGKRILTSSDDLTVRIWDINGKVLKILRAHTAPVKGIIVSRDGKRFLTSSVDGTIRLWDQEGNLLKVYGGHKGDTNGMKFSMDGTKILSASGDKTAQLWDTSGNVLQVFNCTDKVGSVAFTPDEKSIFTGSESEIRLWQVKPPLFSYKVKDQIGNLSISQKLDHGLITYKQILKEGNVDALFEAAQYYENLTTSIGEDDRKLEALTYSKNLLIESLQLNNKVRSLLLLNNIYIDVFQITHDSVSLISEISEIHKVLLETSNIEELQQIFYKYVETYKRLYYNGMQSECKFIPSILAIGDRIVFNFKEDSVARRCVANKSCELAIFLIKQKDFSHALDLSNLAMRADQFYPNSFLLRPLVFLLNNRVDSAMQLYLKSGKIKWVKDIYLNDLNYLEGIGILHPDFPRVKDLLRN
ncbi:MAG: WD40 repeat domain-containing protein [Bacteroidales bacterium]